MHEYTLKITNLTCEACAKVITMTLKKIDGVTSVDVAQDGTTKIVSSTPVDLDVAIATLKEKGYTAIIA